MGVGAGPYMYDAVKKFAISSPDEFLFFLKRLIDLSRRHECWFAI